MKRLKQRTAMFGVLLSTLLLAGCLVDFGERDIRQFAPLNTGVDGQDPAYEPDDGFFGDGLFGTGGLL